MVSPRADQHPGPPSPQPSDAPWPGGHGQMQSGEKEGETGLARQGRRKSPRATEGAPLRSGACFCTFLGVTREGPEPREVLPEHCRVIGGLWASTRAECVLDRGGEARRRCGLWSRSHPWAQRAGPSHVLRAPGSRPACMQWGLVRVCPTIGGTLHRPERDTGLLRVDVPL